MDDVLGRLHVTMDEIRAFCQRWNVVRLELFGSALRPDFDAESDVDILVTFREGTKPGISGLLSMEEDLRSIFGRHVDLVERRLVETSRNWVRRRSILSSARTLYAAA